MFRTNLMDSLPVIVARIVQPTGSRRHTASAGFHRGTLFLVVGPSGAGKDSLIAAARDGLVRNPNFVFPRRFITRAPDQSGEDYWSLTEDEFLATEKAGAFALTWEAHGLRYGVSRRIVDDLASGRNVVVNVSRTAVSSLKARFDPVVVVSVTAPAEVLAERLRARGREDEAAIAQRLDRARAFHVEGEGVVRIDNARSLEGAASEFIEILLG